MFEQNPVLGPGTGTYTSHTFEIIVMLVGAALLGYLIGKAVMKKWKTRTHELEQKLEQTEDALRTTRMELQACGEARASLERTKANQQILIDDLELKLAAVQQRIAELEAPAPASAAPESISVAAAIPDTLTTETRDLADAAPEAYDSINLAYSFNAEAAMALFGSRVEMDDLKIVEGIGPKLEEVLHQQGIRTWRQLADTSVDRLVEILNSADERFAMHNPSTWPEQSRLAAEGAWEQLREYQERLTAGRE